MMILTFAGFSTLFYTGFWDCLIPPPLPESLWCPMAQSSIHLHDRILLHSRKLPAFG